MLEQKPDRPLRLLAASIAGPARTPNAALSRAIRSAPVTNRKPSRKRGLSVHIAYSLKLEIGGLRDGEVPVCGRKDFSNERLQVRRRSIFRRPSLFGNDEACVCRTPHFYQQGRGIARHSHLLKGTV